MQTNSNPSRRTWFETLTKRHAHLDACESFISEVWFNATSFKPGRRSWRALEDWVCSFNEGDVPPRLKLKHIFKIIALTMPEIHGEMPRKMRTDNSTKSVRRRRNNVARLNLLKFMDSVDPSKKLPQFAAEVKCPKCGSTKVTSITVQDRSGDEMQSFSYECKNHSPEPHRWKPPR